MMFAMLIMYSTPVDAKNAADVFVEMSQELIESMKVVVHTRYATAQLNIREQPDVKSKVIGTVNYGDEIMVAKCNKKYVMLMRDNKKVGFISRNYLSKTQPEYKMYHIPEYSGYKSFMDYEKITDESSPQWKLQQEQAYDGEYGIRMVNGRYCVAIGFAFDPKIGQYFDLVLENGVVIPCVIADEKATEDTVDNMYTAANGCYTEFVVDEDCLRDKVTQMGDISYCCNEWKSPVAMIKIYKENVL